MGNASVSPPNGAKFGKLTFISQAPSRRDTAGKSHVYWLCRCDCGIEREFRATNVRSGSSKACGCHKKDNRHKLPDGLANSRYLMSNYRVAARARNLVFELTELQFFDLIKQKCFYCGHLPSQVFEAKGKNGKPRLNGSVTYNGIDRLTNSKGYTELNTVACCGVCNKAKGTMDSEEFIQWIREVYSYLE